MNNTHIPFTAIVAIYIMLLMGAFGQVPEAVHYQGRVTSNGEAYEGIGHFKFVIVKGGLESAETLWSNDGTSIGGSEPETAVSLSVRGGVFSVVLGDETIAGMQSLPASTFAESPVLLRIWFGDGSGEFELLAPDQPITSNPYAMVAGSLAEGVAIRSDQLDPAMGFWLRNGENLWTNDKVGIGITDPEDRLEVDGIVRATGGLRLPDGTLVTALSEIQGMEGP